MRYLGMLCGIVNYLIFYLDELEIKGIGTN